MSKNRFRVFFLILFFAAPSALFAYTGLENSGIITGNIWFSKSPFFEGELIRIYTAVYNSSDATLEGDVEFYDAGKLLGTKRFAVPSGGNLQDVYITWKAIVGEHRLSAKLANTQISISGQKPEAVKIGGDETIEKPIVVESDSDGDQLSNKSEIKNGTDPYKADTDDDDLNDNIDKFPLDKYNGNPPPAPLSAPASASATSPSPIVLVVDGVTQVLGNGLVTEYGTKAATAVDQVDNKIGLVQAQIKNMADKEIKNIKAKIANVQKNQPASTTTFQIKTSAVKTQNTTTNAVRAPFEYAKLAFWYLAYFVFYSSWTVYFILILILYLLFRLWRRRRERYA